MLVLEWPNDVEIVNGESFLLLMTVRSLHLSQIQSPDRKQSKIGTELRRCYTSITLVVRGESTLIEKHGVTEGDMMYGMHTAQEWKVIAPFLRRVVETLRNRANTVIDCHTL